ncbi:MAG: GntR family transcriptional regulator, partial [Lentisphaeria bacterium]|nr:GntR family transcriptional regulator [Lentisphaeria bacterium]
MKNVPKRLRQQSENVAQRGMFFTEKARSDQSVFSPQYMTVANDIIKRIFDGEYRPASKLPSMRTLAKKYGVSVQVVLSALQGLQSLHYIESIPKKGVYVSADIRPARFYRIAVFVLNLSPFAYGGILYPLNRALERAGYNMIIGMNFDGGLSLRHWLNYKRNLDGLIVIGTPTQKQVAQFNSIKLPYVLMDTPLMSDVEDADPEEMKAFTKWFIESYIDFPPEQRPLFRYKQDDPAADLQGYTDYQPGRIYTTVRSENGELAVQLSDSVN